MKILLVKEKTLVLQLKQVICDSRDLLFSARRRTFGKLSSTAIWYLKVTLIILQGRPRDWYCGNYNM